MSFEYKSSYMIMIPTGNKKKIGSGKWGGNLHPSSTSLPPFPLVSILTVIIFSITSEEDLLFLVLLIHINTHNRMEINL